MSNKQAEAGRSNIKKAQSKASSPEARAKAVATFKRRRAEKLARESEIQIPLDAIPDREPKRRYKSRTINNVDPRVELAQAVIALVNKILGETK
jgi:hypothetical protein